MDDGTDIPLLPLVGVTLALCAAAFACAWCARELRDWWRRRHP